MTVALEPAPFSLAAALEPGITVLEASAGTGKTHAIASIAARLVADGAPLSDLLLVTFTRMATGELRERVRGRMLEAEQALQRVAHGQAPPEGDRLLALLAAGGEDAVACRLRRLAHALAGFDAATIATTHGFCGHVLAELGLGGDVEPDATFVEDVSGLVEEAVDDLYVRRFALRDDDPPFRRREALAIGCAAVERPHARLLPDTAGQPRLGAPRCIMRARLAQRVRDEVELRKRRLGIMTYDDLLTRVRTTLAHPVSGEAACARLGARYPWVLVDEFQDTDPIQWQILELAFGRGGCRLILIGDPKQAIYAFRGADVYAYLEAAAAARATFTLDTNWRSDGPLIDALDALFAGAQLGHERIVHRPVRPAPGRSQSGLEGAPDGAPLRLRVLRREDAPRLSDGCYTSDDAEELIATDLAADIADLLASQATVREGDERLPIEPRHVAVLVRTNDQAELVRGALVRAGVAAVEHGAGSVFETAAARDWLRLLEALERPTSDGRAHAAALTAFLGWSVERVATAGEDDWEELHTRLHAWAELLARSGVASLLDAAYTDERLPARLLTYEDGAREVTNIRHVGALLHAEAQRHGLGAAALARWLRRRIDEAGGDAAEERLLRLDTDDEAVQVLTIYRSKGLEFPVVYVPFAWVPGYIDHKKPPTFHDGGWIVDVGGRHAPDAWEHRRKSTLEQRGEDLRLLYVALTRARHQVVAWWAGIKQSGESPLGRMLLARQADGSIAVKTARRPTDDEVEQRLAEVAAAVPGCLAVEHVPMPPEPRRQPPHTPAEALAAAGTTRCVDGRWGRASYSRIVAREGERRVASEPEQEVRADEPPLEAAPAAAQDEEEALRAVALPLAAMPAGAAVGDLVHRVLAAADFASTDLDGELAACLERERRRRDALAGGADTVVAGLRAALETPLAPLLGDLRLCDVARPDRLDELVFELPLAGGERPSGAVAPADIAALLDSHLPADDLLAGYAERLRDPALAGGLRGYLTGTIDLVLRSSGEDGARFSVVDYKSNRLAAEGEELSAWQYRPAALAEAMQLAHYPLQALLYLVALHRYLRWRLPGYDAGRDLGGVLYLFLRGMCGAATPRVCGRPCGVFSWRPPAGLVEALSDLFDRGGTEP